jgi:diguanylate cyclase (GGDEF)-like protein
MPSATTLAILGLLLALSIAAVTIAVSVGGFAGGTIGVIAVLALYIASALTIAALRRSELGRVRDLVDALNSSNQRLAELSVQDELTKIYNRRYFHEQLERELGRSRRYGEPFSVVLFDIDHLKAINDGLGHLAGDELLRTFATVIKNDIRTTDVCARIGEDEFAVLATNTNYEGATVLSTRIATILAQTPVDLQASGLGGKAMVAGTATWGIATYSAADDSGNTLDAADIISWAEQEMNARKIEKQEAETFSQQTS